MQDDLVVIVNADSDPSLSEEFIVRQSLTISGQASGEANGLPTIFRQSGGITCDSRQGCTGLTLQSVNLVCTHNLPTKSGPLKVSGPNTVLHLINSNISKCASMQDGGSVVVSDGAELKMSDSSIEFSSSQAWHISFLMSI